MMAQPHSRADACATSSVLRTRLSPPVQPPRTPLVEGTASGLARIDRDRGAQRAGETLEAALDDMVVVLAVEILDVQRQAGILREGLEPFLEQLGVHLAELRG